MKYLITTLLTFMFFTYQTVRASEPLFNSNLNQNQTWLFASASTYNAINSMNVEEQAYFNFRNKYIFQAVKQNPYITHSIIKKELTQLDDQWAKIKRNAAGNYKIPQSVNDVADTMLNTLEFAGGATGDIRLSMVAFIAKETKNIGVKLYEDLNRVPEQIKAQNEIHDKTSDHIGISSPLYTLYHMKNYSNQNIEAKKIFDLEVANKTGIPFDFNNAEDIVMYAPNYALEMSKRESTALQIKYLSGIKLSSEEEQKLILAVKNEQEAFVKMMNNKINHMLEAQKELENIKIKADIDKFNVEYHTYAYFTGAEFIAFVLRSKDPMAADLVLNIANTLYKINNDFAKFEKAMEIGDDISKNLAASIFTLNVYMGVANLIMSIGQPDPDEVRFKIIFEMLSGIQEQLSNLSEYVQKQFEFQNNFLISFSEFLNKQLSEIRAGIYNIQQIQSMTIVEVTNLSERFRKFSQESRANFQSVIETLYDKHSCEVLPNNLNQISTNSTEIKNKWEDCSKSIYNLIANVSKNNVLYSGNQIDYQKRSTLSKKITRDNIDFGYFYQGAPDLNEVRNNINFMSSLLFYLGHTSAPLQVANPTIWEDYVSKYIETYEKLKDSGIQNAGNIDDSINEIDFFLQASESINKFNEATSLDVDDMYEVYDQFFTEYKTSYKSYIDSLLNLRRAYESDLSKALGANTTWTLEQLSNNGKFDQFNIATKRSSDFPEYSPNENELVQYKDVNDIRLDATRVKPCDMNKYPNNPNAVLDLSQHTKYLPTIPSELYPLAKFNGNSSFYYCFDLDYDPKMEKLKNSTRQIGMLKLRVYLNYHNIYTKKNNKISETQLTMMDLQVLLWEESNGGTRNTYNFDPNQNLRYIPKSLNHPNFDAWLIVQDNTAPLKINYPTIIKDFMDNTREKMKDLKDYVLPAINNEELYENLIRSNPNLEDELIHVKNKAKELYQIRSLIVAFLDLNSPSLIYFQPFYSLLYGDYDQTNNHLKTLPRAPDHYIVNTWLNLRSIEEFAHGYERELLLRGLQKITQLQEAVLKTHMHFDELPFTLNSTKRIIIQLKGIKQDLESLKNSDQSTAIIKQESTQKDEGYIKSLFKDFFGM
ncbi:MAG: hypothetical protein KDD58_02360 [Bdellovibrionales bacterium]|nr:hypothetical protein [Bdellovibrionales bacterium]